MSEQATTKNADVRVSHVAEMRLLKALEGWQHVRHNQPVLYWWPAMQIAEEQNAYLTYVARQSKSVAHWRNMGYRLSFWHNYCLAADIDWRHASLDDLLAYKDAMETSISAQTGAPLASGTVGLRMGAVIASYAWYGRHGYYHGDIGNDALPEAVARRALDSDPLAHLGGQAVRHRHSGSEYIPKAQPEEPRPLQLNEVRALQAALGPSPGERTGVDQRLSRDRLMGDWGWAVGLRVSELVGLTVHQIDALSSPGDAHLSVRRKGGRVLTVRVPEWLVNETKIYVQTERKTAEDLGQAKTGQTSSALFLVGTDSNRVGNPLSCRRYQGIFYEACLKAGLTKRVERMNPDDGSLKVAEVPNHHVHDLRHTYAVLTYWMEVANGNSEPWKLIQIQLGHKQMQTTVDTYLRFVGGKNPFQRASTRDLIDLPRSYSK